MRALISIVGVAGLTGLLWAPAMATVPLRGSIGRSVDLPDGSISRSVVPPDGSIGRSVDPVTQSPNQPSSKVVRVTAERFAYTPSEIVVDRGTTVEFHLTSEDTDHGFRIIDTDIDVRIPKRRRGETVVRHTADTAGRFVIECSRPCGAGHTAMRAVLVVK